ncbi:MAG TPA: hypothetical protein DCF42_04990 [Lachnospiraceae bacterium]|nr:hypothetical protein [Lachnospiraceae bacterium]
MQISGTNAADGGKTLNPFVSSTLFAVCAGYLLQQKNSRQLDLLPGGRRPWGPLYYRICLFLPDFQFLRFLICFHNRLPVSQMCRH